MKKLAIIFGTRPEAIKYGPIINVLKNDHRFEINIISTGQHREMLTDALEAFDIKVDIELNVMKSGQGLPEITSKILYELNIILPKLSPDAILVHGDTATTLSGALAGFQLQIPVIHVEAGLRSGDIQSPFPEEGNRKLVAQIASLHLSPTPGNAANLIREGIKESSIVITGNTIVDSLYWARNRKDIPVNSILKNIKNDDRKIILASAHRRESWGRLSEIVNAIKKISERKDIKFVIPMHKNPTVRSVFIDKLSGIKNIALIEPLNYLDFCNLMYLSDIILSDSSGAEEEGPTIGKPTLVLRNLTERPEATISGSAILVGTSEELIVKNVNYILDNLSQYIKENVSTNHYGDGNATIRIVGAIADFFGMGPAVSPFYSSCYKHQYKRNIPALL
ncbi:UDP-N-acetylglucosamine 2-epimerase (non-hydrolyzing) [Xenorhabdus sp. XENO-10]|uniref:UDP-N-acetylglucosamine 2-epimerase (non-hydrolyzing) n=1 Tax=Xenorhabdus yunnanensis TaxID=3025878 RepID=A0ABT5LC34_9GAMM|nr:UDP-N-acetylglucosamine 2-epimerase (non-hydrolyzing) [Xenorhabdus yunnanensis]MDC9588530.1 UDP-N-acetylglucosamine 2-epimerase (non-hydrolyzing) [Xenorhabdus yunnanensis]